MRRHRLIPMWLAILGFVGALACNPVAFFAGNAEESESSTPQAVLPGSTPPSMAPTPIVVRGKLGERLAAQGVAVTVDNAEFNEAAGEPEQGKIYLLVHIHVENTNDKEELDVSPGDFDVKPRDGEAIDFTPLDGLSDQLEDTKLKPGSSLTGTVGYRVVKEAVGWHLLYDFNDQHIDIDLGF